jgi:serine/threonine protein kinase
MPRPHRSGTVRIRGRERPVRERLTIGRRTYYLLDRVGSALRERSLAFDPMAGPGGDFFLVQRLPHGAAAEQYVRVLKRLKGDSIPKVLEFHRQRDHLLVVSTWVEGISLNNYFEHVRSGRRPLVAPSEALRLIRGLAAGVCQLHHGRQIAHGDIQPANIIITSHPSRLVLIDYGSAWPTQETTFRSDGDGRHRLYAAPEMQTGQSVDGFLADQFSVGVIAFELLVLQLPYGGLGGKAGRPENIGRARHALVPPSQLAANHRLPRSLWEVIDRVTLRSLAIDPAQRYPTRQEWLNDLFSAFTQVRLQPSLPAATGVWQRLAAWRNRSS